MKNKLALFVLVFASSFANAQVKDRLSIGVNFQHNIPFGSLGNEIYIYDYCWQPIQFSEQNFIFSSGVQFNYGFAKNWEISSGVQYSRYEYINNFFCGCFEPCVEPNDKTFSNSGLDLPLQLRFYMLPGKFKMHADVGQKVGLALLREYDRVVMNYGVTGGLGVDYFLNRFQFSLSANYRRSLLSNKNSYHFQQKNNLGIEFKTSFALNK